jgi:hypothetical protein
VEGDPRALVAWQLPTVLVGLGVWWIGMRFELMPPVSGVLRSGGSWRRVIVNGLIATAIVLGILFTLGAAMGPQRHHPPLRHPPLRHPTFRLPSRRPQRSHPPPCRPQRSHPHHPTRRRRWSHLPTRFLRQRRRLGRRMH